MDIFVLVARFIAITSLSTAILLMAFAFIRGLRAWWLDRRYTKRYREGMLKMFTERKGD